VVVDVQWDFLPPDGNLAVPDGPAVIPVIQELCRSGTFDLIVFTQDWHPPGHVSFASSHPGHKPLDEVDVGSPPVRQTLWPSHCVQGSHGAEIHPDLLASVDETAPVGFIQKGSLTWVDSYSGFWDNARGNATGLDSILRKHEVTRVVVCGLAMDFCVGYTALDALEGGFETSVVLDATRGMDKERVEAMLGKIVDRGGFVRVSQEFITRKLLG